MKGVGEFMSCYDDSFDEDQFKLYNYDATYRNVKSLFNKYRMFKNKVFEEIVNGKIKCRNSVKNFVCFPTFFIC